MKRHFNIKHLIISQSLFFWIVLLLFVNEMKAQTTHYSYNDFLELSTSVRQDLPPGWDYQTNSSNPHGIIVFTSANPRINEIPLQPGDFIGTFYTDGNGQLQCGGADIWLGDENIIFGAFGNDPDTPEKDGFAPAEIMFFKVFLQETQKEYDVDFVQWSPEYTSTNKWYPLGLSAMINLLCEVEFDAYATVDPEVICLGDIVTLEAEIFIETSGNYTYQWSSVPEGFSSTEAMATAQPTENTIFLLQVSDGINISNHQVSVNVVGFNEVNAGNDQTICSSNAVSLSASAVNHSSLVWNTSGDGTFANPTLEETIYFPGNLDIASQTVHLSIIVQPISPCTFQDTDSLLVIIEPAPQLIVPNSLTYCISAPVFIEATVANESEFFWVTSGDGTFEDAHQSSTQYFPGDADKAAKVFTITANAAPIPPCDAVVSSSTNVTLLELPTVNAPSLRLICEGSAANVNGIAFNYSAIEWVTQGDGTFTNPSALSTQYFSGVSDVAAGGTVVAIRAYGTDACGTYFSFKNIQIIINKNPEVMAGDDMTICESSQLFLNATAVNFSVVSWTTSGDGFFSNTNILNPVYFPGLLDKANGNVELTIFANPLSPCTATSSDNITAIIVPQAQVSISPVNAATCYGNSFSITGASYSNVSEVSWFTTNGSGTFDDPGSFIPTYNPNPQNDYALGCIVIGLAAQPFEPCSGTTYAYMSLCFNPAPDAFAGNDITIFSHESHSIEDATASHFAGVSWQTTGDGTFSDYANLLTEYFPGNQDIEQQNVKIVLTAEPLAGCNQSVSDTTIITIFSKQSFEVPAGANGFSLFIHQDEKNFEEIMEQFEGKIIFAKAMNEVFWPEYNINTIGNFSNHQGYIIYLNETATADYSGLMHEDKTIQLKEGWNILPVISSCNQSSQVIIDQLGDDLIMMVDVEGSGMIYPQQNINTLQIIVPGKAYMIKLAGDASLTFPSCQ